MYQVDFNKPCKVFFIGIGGISMSGLAEILLMRGFSVCGSDMKESDIVGILRDKGAKVSIGQAASNITEDISCVIYTAAIHPDNPEFMQAQALGLPMLTRAELLGQVMKHYRYSIAVSGTHGKTTTTSMLSWILLEAETDPTVSIGGMLDVIGGNIRVGHTDYFVTEACEYTNSYHALSPYISIILNVDADHLDFFKDIHEIEDSFKTFAEKLPKDGLLIVNGDMDCTDYIKKDIVSRAITFGLNEDNNYRAIDITFDEMSHPTYTLSVDGVPAETVTLSVTGIHNVMNSLSAIAAADFLGIDRAATLRGLAKCSSAKRRFEKKGITADGITVIDDYAHHPTEISATLTAAKNLNAEKLVVCFQPHTYTRTKALLPEFAEALTLADEVLLADIYAAREKDDGSVSSKDLAEAINAKGGHAVYLGDFASITDYVKNNCKKNYLLITMGAGNIDSIGDLLLKK